jgi:hypothetical protein
MTHDKLSEEERMSETNAFKNEEITKFESGEDKFQAAANTALALLQGDTVQPIYPMCPNLQAKPGIIYPLCPVVITKKIQA